MNKEPFNHIEQKIREAARQVEPPFNEAAWEKMEMKLDAEEDRRRPVLWWMLTAMLLLIGAGGAYFLLQPANVDTMKYSTENTDHKTYAPSFDKNHSANKSENGKPSNDQPANISVLPGENKTGQTNASSKHGISGRPGKDVSGSTAGSPVRNKTNAESGRLIATITRAGVEEQEENNFKSASIEEEHFSKDRLRLTVTPEEEDAHKKNETLPQGMQPDASKVEDESKNSNDTIQQKKKAKREAGLYLMASVGPEVTAVSASRVDGKDISPRFGFLVGYQFNNKLSLQTGFYSVSKKYAAGKDDYDPKYYTYITSAKDLVIDANCRVIEIPLSVRYNILNGSKTSWFISGGLAGVLMKREHYRFTYTEGSYPYVGIRTEEKAFTGNRHLLSFAQVSGGFSRKMSPAFSLIAEPYISFPLHGVGEGRVKLFSAGVQFGIRYMPLKK